ncbi:MAG: beta-propeller domain-containing protein [Clostridia bacterium]|nr:beta-propeller domain-containing protein [Clostridia bacterium]
MRTYKERTENIKAAVRAAQKRRKTVRRALLGSCAAIAITAVNFALFMPFHSELPDVSAYANSEYYGVIKRMNEATYEPPEHKNNYERLASGVNDFFDSFFRFGCAAGGLAAAPPLDYATEQNGEYVETTDNQTQGVIEGDLIKRTDKYIFYLADLGERFELRAYTIEKEDSMCIGSYTIHAAENTRFASGERVEMYLSQDGGQITVIVPALVYGENEKTLIGRYTAIVALDVSEVGAITEIRRTYLSGDYNTSRLVDGELLVMSNYRVEESKLDFGEESTFLPQYGALAQMQSVAAEDIVSPETLAELHYTFICRIDQDLTVVDSTAFLSYSEQIYVSADNIFATREYTKRLDEGETYQMASVTEIATVSYADGDLDYIGSFEVEGIVKNQYFMDEYEGVLRVITEDSERVEYAAQTDKAIKWYPTNANLYCVRLSDFVIAGSVERFAPDGETVESVRFKNEKAYACTAYTFTPVPTDPVFAFDLSDLSNITYTDTGTIEGYSTSLIDFKDGYLLGIGYGSSLSELKIEIYEETETAVESVCEFTNFASFSEEYKSYLIDRENGLIGLGMNDGEYILLTFDGYDLTVTAHEYLEGANKNKRALYIDGYLYVFGEDVIDGFKLVKIV